MILRRFIEHVKARNWTAVALGFVFVMAACAATAGCANGHSKHERAAADDGTAWMEKCAPGDPWDKAGPPYRIFGNAYYVGTCAISAILVAGDDGHVIIDGGPRNGGPLIAANVETLGFAMTDVEFLLHSHEHFDHVGGLAEVQKRSGARVVSSRRAAPVLESGVISDDDPQAGTHAPFTAVKVDAIVGEGDVVRLGEIELTAMETPGHTPGALSWTWRQCEHQICRTLVYMDSISPVSSDTYRFIDHPEYLARYRASLRKLAAIPCDIALTPHADFDALSERLASKSGFVDGDCKLYIDYITAALERRLEKERSTTQGSP